jgi:hypothetical protein
LRSVASLVLVALIAGAIAAQADSGPAPRARRTPVRVIAPPAHPLAAAGALGYRCAAPAPINPKRPLPTPAQPKPSTAPPSQALLDAFAILRRPRTDQDALSPEAAEALKARGLSPVSPDSARLLRSTPSGGKAWVVPVPDVVGRYGLLCAPGSKPRPREGLAVVATGDAASGGGGALDDLVRGRAPVTVAPCAGADHSMLSISGIVPNGVGPRSSPPPMAPRCAPTSRTTATSSCSRARRPSSSATSCGPGETARRTSSRWPPSASRVRTRARRRRS